jgi:uncharacterized membrane protein YgcG
MSAYDVSNAHEWVELYDHATGGTIICAHRNVVQSLLRDNTLAHVHHEPCHADDEDCADLGMSCGASCSCDCHQLTLHIAKRPLGFLGDSKCFAWDEMPSPRNLEPIARIVVDYATFLAIQLSRTPQVIVHCTNSRSRSPNVILAFLLLFRTMEIDLAKLWMCQAFREQRPDAHRRSGSSDSFPNFAKFERVLSFLEVKKISADRWLSDRVEAVCDAFNAHQAAKRQQHGGGGDGGGGGGGGGGDGGSGGVGGVDKHMLLRALLPHSVLPTVDGAPAAAPTLFVPQLLQGAGGAQGARERTSPASKAAALAAAASMGAATRPCAHVLKHPSAWFHSSAVQATLRAAESGLASGYGGFQGSQTTLASRYAPVEQGGRRVRVRQQQQQPPPPPQKGDGGMAPPPPQPARKKTQRQQAGGGGEGVAGRHTTGWRSRTAAGEGGGQQQQQQQQQRQQQQKWFYSFDEDEQGVAGEEIECEVCRSGDSTDHNDILFCDGGCLKMYHQLCHKPAVRKVPEGDWICAACKLQRRQVRRQEQQQKSALAAAAATKGGGQENGGNEEDEDDEEGKKEEGVETDDEQGPEAAGGRRPPAGAGRGRGPGAGAWQAAPQRGGGGRSPGGGGGRRRWQCWDGGSGRWRRRRRPSAGARGVRRRALAGRHGALLLGGAQHALHRVRR